MSATTSAHTKHSGGTESPIRPSWKGKNGMLNLWTSAIDVPMVKRTSCLTDILIDLCDTGVVFEGAGQVVEVIQSADMVALDGHQT